MSGEQSSGLRYFPLTSGQFEHQFGIRALADGESIVEATAKYADEIQTKRSALVADRDYYFQALPSSADAQREVAELVCASASWLPDSRNTLLDQAVECEADAPLLSIAQHVQEDLTIMDGNPATGHAMIAGCVTFPSGWCVQDKIGKPLLAIHASVPQYDSALHPPTEKLMERLKPGRHVWRMNWGVRASERLDQSPRFLAAINDQRERITAGNAGDQAFFRVERQTLARLPVSGHILFAIHTHQCCLDELSGDQRRHLLGVLQTCPVETLKYKGIWPMLAPLVEHLSV